jgi:trans-aconitate methyltransferase
MHRLSDGLWSIRRSLSRDRWLEFSREAIAHDIRELIHEDPFTRRSFSKPRGYAGDAALLDLIYCDLAHPAPQDMSPLGYAIYDRNKNTPAPVAVRERRDFVASLIDEVSEENHGETMVLAAACGHLREAERSRALQGHQQLRIVALDQDEESLAEVDRRYRHLGVETKVAKIKSLIGPAFPKATFHLIYAAGLFDYLEQRFASRLVERMFEILRPGGRLIVGNFVPDILDSGYMETYMGWALNYRDMSSLAALADGIPDSEVALKSIYTLLSPDIAYLEVRRRA